jgi:hypothetical protein
VIAFLPPAPLPPEVSFVFEPLIDAARLEAAARPVTLMVVAIFDVVALLWLAGALAGVL